MCLGCMFGLALAMAPRLMLILAWIFSERWDRVWQGVWLWPLLGIIFAPYTTVMYMLVWGPGGIEQWDWLWIALGVILDLAKWSNVWMQRRTIPGYPETLP